MKLSRLRRSGHHHCLACTHPDLKLNFTLDGPHRLRSSIDFTKEMTSFNGMIHGGLIALLIDEAMTCALMAEGHYCATGDLKLRYHQPTRPEPTAYITVTVDSKFGKLYRLSAELKQKGVLCASAQARFMKQAIAS
ncbi:MULTISPECIES: PaaI family thioesterase [unclassified Lentimonas]|nr:MULTISPECIES: PaaI family thioesterase [unclassified Lentimonas]